MIRITRETTSFYSEPRYKIFINGIYRGEIENGETKDFEVENGSHTVYAKINYVRSPEFRVEVNNSTVNLEVGCSLIVGKSQLYGIIYPLAYSTIWRDKYLWLREAKEADGANPDLPVQFERSSTRRVGAIIHALMFAAIGRIWFLIRPEIELVLFCAVGFAVSIYVLVEACDWRITFEADYFTHQRLWRKPHRVSYDSIERYRIEGQEAIRFYIGEKKYCIKRKYMANYQDSFRWNEFLIWLESRLGEHKKEPERDW